MSRVKLLFINIIILLCFSCNSQVTENVKNIESKNDKVYKINVLTSSQHGDTLELVSDDNLVWKPFVGELSAEEFQKRYNNAFKVEEQGELVKLQAKGSKIILTVNEPVENAEKLAEHHHSKVPPYSLREAKISTTLVELQYGIRIGMNKADFFKMLNFSSDVENSVNVIRIFDPPGDAIEQSYLFKDGKLEVIEMKLPPQ